MRGLSATGSGGRNLLLAGCLSVAMHAGLLWGVAGTATTPQFRIAQEFSVTLVRQSEQRTRSAPPPAADPTPKANPPAPESRETARVQPERQAPQPERPQAHKPAPAPQAPADTAEAADRQDSAGQPVPQTQQASTDYLNNPLPHYPNAARRRGLEGQVVLNVEVLATGRCGRIDILQSSGHTILDEAAIEAVKRWHFIPASDAGLPVDHWLHIPIRFRLSGRSAG
ncbi:MAG TPA: energy transducer TonB [Mariprofundaceae bacterium]|nr:energy transducer TonB [Mariprofundaceae bacterium]